MKAPKVGRPRLNDIASLKEGKRVRINLGAQKNKATWRVRQQAKKLGFTVEILVSKNGYWVKRVK